VSIFPPVYTLHAVRNSVRQLVSANIMRLAGSLGSLGSLMTNAATVLLLKHICPMLNEHKVLLRVTSAATASTQGSFGPISAKLHTCHSAHQPLIISCGCSMGIHHKSDLLTGHYYVNAVVRMGLGKIWQLG